MDSVSFNNGLSGISRVQQDLMTVDFPHNKTTFKPSGNNVVAYIWKALDYNLTFDYKEKRFALQQSGNVESLSPEEHQMMREQALVLLRKLAVSDPIMVNAVSILDESKSLHDELNRNRHALHAA